MRCLFLYNPNSGKGKIAKKLPYIKAQLSTRYQEVVTYATASEEDLYESAKRGAKEFDALVFAGGDGTVHHILNAVKDSKITLGYLPCGTVNDVARSLRLPHSLKGGLKVILEGNCAEVDDMLVNGVCRVAYVAAAGAFTFVTYRTSQKKKRAFGWFAYVFEALKHRLKYDVFPVKITCDGKSIEANVMLVLVMNGHSVARFPINRKGGMQDGKVEVVLVEQKKNPNFFRRFASIFLLARLFLFGWHKKRKKVCYLQGERLEICVGEEVLWDFDGEEGQRGKIEVAVRKRAVKIFAPKNKKI